MRYTKHFIVIIAIIAMSIVLSNLMVNHDLILFKFILPGFILIMFLFSIIVRKNVRFKPFFTSKYNILTNKYSSSAEFEFSKDLLFFKIIEVLQDSEFKVRFTDESTGEIFATSGLAWTSWGENIYINIKYQNGITSMEFCSATIFGIYSWGRNEDNYHTLLNKFEQSLTI